MSVQRAVISIRVIPNATKNEIAGFAGNVLRVKIAAPPVKGKANEELLDFLCRLLAVDKNRISIIRGHTARNKVIAIDGISKQSATELLLSGQDKQADCHLLP